MKKIIGMLLLSLVLFSGDKTHEHGLCHMIPISAAGKTVAVDSGTGLSQDDFLLTIKNFIAVNKPLVAEMGGQLQVKNMWTNETVNSDTTLSGTKWIIHAYGGLARSDGMTIDAYTMVLSHELGHHLGGAPQFPAPDNWASVEGEADYFAATKGFRRMAYANMLPSEVPHDIPTIIAEKCQTDFQGSMDIAVCERSAMAALTLAEILRQLGDEPQPVSPDVQDETVVSKTYDEHPAAQCRFDTMMAGSACAVQYTVPFSDTNPTVGACNSGVGARPRCWFKPGKLMMFTASI